MPDFSYEVTKEIGVISEGNGGWARELNMVSWNGREPKYDIRDWAPGKEKMGKGLSFTADELKSLRDLHNEIEL